MRLQQQFLSRAGNLVMYRTQLEFRYDFREPTPDKRPDPPPGADFRFPCEPDDLATWSFEGGTSEREQIGRYMADEDQLAVIRYGNEVACRGLVRKRGHLTLEAHRQARPLREGEAFIHYCRTASAFAGRSLYPQMLRAILWSLSERDDITEVTITCRDDNVPSIKGIERAGFRLDRRLTTIGLLGGRLARTWHTEVANHHD